MVVKKKKKKQNVPQSVSVRVREPQLGHARSFVLPGYISTDHILPLSLMPDEMVITECLHRSITGPHSA